MKMFILIHQDLPAALAPVVAAHAALGGYLAFKDDPYVITWASEIFHKVVCRVGPEEFETAKTFERSKVFTESSMGGQEVAIALAPRPEAEWPKPVKFYPLWKPF
jgi:peptidyl-tRNA hydrolase